MLVLVSLREPVSKHSLKCCKFGEAENTATSVARYSYFWHSRAESPMLLWCEAAFVALERAGETVQLPPNEMRQLSAQLALHLAKHFVRLPINLQPQPRLAQLSKCTNCPLSPRRQEFMPSKSILPVTPEHAMSEAPSYRAEVPVIVVLGPTGVGKSSFINIATGNANVHIGHGLESGKSALLWLRTRTTNNPLKRLTGLLPSQLRLMGTRSICLTRLASMTHIAVMRKF